MAAMNELDQRLKAIETFASSVMTITDATTGETRTLAESIKRIEALAEFVKRIEGWMAGAEPVMRTMIDNPRMIRDEIEKTISAKAFPPPGMSGGFGGSGQWSKPILESKAVQDIGVLLEGKRYRRWNMKLKNAVEGSRPSVRKVLDVVEKLSEEDIEKEYKENLHMTYFEAILVV